MKKSIAFTLCLAMLMTLFTAMPVSAELSTTIIDGKTYYQIGTAADYLEFVTMANADLTINGILTADIDLSGETVTSIGTAPNSGQSTATSYQGIFDGNNHVIRNMSISRLFSAVANAAIAMFNMTDGATIKNLGIENATITNTGAKDGVFLSALVGRSYGTTIENCYVKNSNIVSTAKNKYIQAAGPIAAFINSTTVVSNCYSTGNSIGFTASGGTANGGVAIASFVGWLGQGTGASNIVNSYAKGNTLLNRPSGQKSAGFARVGSGGDTNTQFEHSYTDKKTGFDASTTMGYYASDADEWSDGTVLAGLNNGGSAWKADTYGVNGNAPRLSWEKEPAIYSITVDAVTNGTVEAPITAAGGATVMLTVTADYGYKIDWIKINGEEIAAPYSFTMPDEDVTITAQFMAPHSITVTPTENGTVTADEKAYKGETINLIVTADDGYKIDCVKVNDEEIVAPYSFTMPDEDVTITAQFMAPYSITVTPAENGAVTAPEKAYKGETVNLTVKASSGYKTKWVKINGEEIPAPYSFKMPSENVVITSEFEEVSEGEMTTTVIDGEIYYQISTAGHYKKFVELANKDLSINAILMADIDLSGWEGKPIGIWNRSDNVSEPYTGTFDGNGHVISNLTIIKEITSLEDAGIGMFAHTYDATIKNLGLNYAKIISTGKQHQYSIAALVARARGKTTIEGCFVKNSIIKSTQNDYYIEGGGAIAGLLASTGKAIDCYAVGNTIGFDEDATYSGGGGLSALIGFTGTDSTAETIQNCYAMSNTLSHMGNQVHAGFARFGWGGLVIGWDNCYTDMLLANDESSPMTKFDTDAPEWTTLANELGPAYKNGIAGIFSGAPKLYWESEPSVYNISVTPSAHGTITAPTEAYEDATISLTVASDIGYSVDWIKINGTEIEAPYTFRMPPCDAEITAAFMLPYDIAVAPIAHGTINVAEKAFRGETVELTPTPDYAYILDWIKVNGELLEPSEEDGTYSFIMTDGPVTITAEFISAHTITIVPAEHGTVTAPEAAFRDTEIALTIAPDSGYALDWIKVDGVEIASPYTFVMPDSDVTVTVAFMPPHNITETHTGNGRVVIPATAFRGETVTVRPLPNSAYTVDWVKINSVELKSPYKFVMPANDVSIETKFITKIEKNSRDYVKEDADEVEKYINSNYTTNYITKSITFLAEATHGSTITYTSSNENVMTNSGVIRRPANSDAEITLTVLVTRTAEIEGENVTFSDERKINFIVKKDTTSSNNTSGGGGAGGGGGGGNSYTGGGGGVSSVATGGGLVVTSPQNNTSSGGKVVFADTQSHWAKDYIEKLYDEGIISGKAEGKFAPDDNITREEFITLLIKALGIETVTRRSKFSDVNDDDWFAPYVMTAFENNIVNGISTDKFGIAANISRQDMCVMVYNAMKDLLETSEADEKFADDGKIADYAKAAVYSLKNSGIVSGRGDNSFESLGTATRAEAARIIYSLHEILFGNT